MKDLMKIAETIAQSAHQIANQRQWQIAKHKLHRRN